MVIPNAIRCQDPTYVTPELWPCSEISETRTFNFASEVQVYCQVLPQRPHPPPPPGSMESLAFELNEIKECPGEGGAEEGGGNIADVG